MSNLFDTTADDLLISVYQKHGRTLDDLPYTPEFEAIRTALGDPDSPAARAKLFRRLHNLRKAGRLPRLGRADSKPPRIAPEHEKLLTDLVVAELGQLSLRDQLPYTAAFDRIIQTFNARAAMSLSPHDTWRIIAKLAK